MKKWMIALALLAGFSLSAQRGQGHPHKAHHMQEFSPQEAATLKSKQMALELGLDARQQSEVQSLLVKEMEWRKANRAERQAQKGADTTATAAERYARMNAHMDQRLAFQRNLKSILTEAQFAQWMEHHKGRRGGKRSGKRMGRH